MPGLKQNSCLKNNCNCKSNNKLAIENNNKEGGV